MIPSANAISLLDLQNEYGGSDPIGIDEYYRSYYLYPTNVLDITYNSDIPQKTTPTNPQIALNNFYGKSKVRLKTVTWSFGTSGWWYVPSDLLQTFTFQCYVVGGGGQGAGWPSGAEGGGGGEMAYLYTQNNLVPNTAYKVIIGAGGTGAPRVETGAAGGNSSFGESTDYYIYARGGLGGIGSGGATSRNHAARSEELGSIDRRYFLGGATSGRGGAPKHSLWGGGGGASNCYSFTDTRNNVVAGGASTYAPIIFSYGSTDIYENNTGASSIDYTYARGGYGCGGGDHRISNRGYFPGGGGGGADYNATGGNGASGGVFITLKYYGSN